MDDATKQIVQMVVGSAARHVLGAAAVWMVGHQILPSAQQTDFVDLGAGMACGAALAAWKWFDIYGRAMVQAHLKKMTGTPTLQAATAVAVAAPSTPPPAVVALAARVAAVFLLALLLWPAGADAQTKRLPLTGNVPADIQNLKDKIGGQPQGSNEGAGVTGGTAATDKIAQLLAKPFNDIADFINSDVAAAAALATKIPGLQDGHGQQCWMAMGQFTAVIKAHPIPLTFRGATDLEAFRLANMAANNLCSNVHCTQVFSDLSNAVQQVAGQVGGALVSGGLQIPSLNSLCSKIPQVPVIAPVADAAAPVIAPSSTPTPAPTPTPSPSPNP